MKKTSKLILTICCVILFSVSIIGVFAYFTSIANKKNDFTIGGNSIEIVEDFEPPEFIEAGISFKKDVQVKNTGLSDCYVRLKVVFSDSDMEKFCSFTDLNTTDWIYNPSDNYYYYTQRVANNELTPSLFTTVAISNTMESYQIKEFEIYVYAESVQADPFEDYEEAWTEYAKHKTNN